MSDWQLWILLIAVLVVLAIVIWWWWKGRGRQPVVPSEPIVRVAPKPVAEPVHTAVVAPVVKAVVPDDLTIIEGIGPKTAAVLNAAGIRTLAELGTWDPAKLLEILKSAGLTLGDPTTWPQQAALAAAGKLDDLKALQGSLKGGRRS